MLPWRLIFALSFVCSVAFPDEGSRKAVANVQAQLSQPGFSKTSAKDSPEAANVAKQVDAMTGGGSNTDDVYALAADVLGNMKDMDTETMMKVVAEAQKDPEAFAKTFTPAQQKKLHDLSGRLPAASATTP